MHSKSLITLALASAFAFSTPMLYAEDDKQEAPKPELVSQSDEKQEAPKPEPRKPVVREVARPAPPKPAPPKPVAKPRPAAPPPPPPPPSLLEEFLDNPLAIGGLLGVIVEPLLAPLGPEPLRPLEQFSFLLRRNYLGALPDQPARSPDHIAAGVRQQHQLGGRRLARGIAVHGDGFAVAFDYRAVHRAVNQPQPGRQWFTAADEAGNEAKEGQTCSQPSSCRSAHGREIPDGAASGQRVRMQVQCPMPFGRGPRPPACAVAASGGLKSGLQTASTHSTAQGPDAAS